MPYRSSSGVRGGEATVSARPGDGRIVLIFGRATLGLLPAFGFPFDFALPFGLGRTAVVCDFIAVMDRPDPADLPAGFAVRVDAVRVDLALDAGLAIAPDLAAVVMGRAVLLDLAAEDRLVRDFAAPVLADVLLEPPALADVLLEPPALLDFAAVPRAVLRDRAAAFGAGRATDAVLTAADSDLAAVVMALVAVFIACRAVDIVLADDVALVAAAVILVAAEVTLVAAVETVRAAEVFDGELVEAFRVVLTAVDRVLALVFGRRAARLGVLPLVDLARAGLAGLRRAAVRAVVRAGTDLPPSRSITEVLFHGQRRFTHPVTVLPGEQWPQAA